MLSARGAHGYPPSFPPRPSDSRSPLSSRVPTSSPPRKVVTDFAAFGAARSSSVYGTAVQSTPFSLAGNKAAFGSIRTNTQTSAYDDEDEDEEQSEGKQKVFLKEDSITLDQVRSRVPCFSSSETFADWSTPTLTTWTCRLVVLPCRAHGVVLLEASVPVGYLLGRLSIVFSLLSSLNCMLPLPLMSPRQQ
jgi:hypothetical protein